MKKDSSCTLLSICIPTYNRAENLERSLNSYVNSEGFDDQVEIIISDNASSDNTKEVAEKFVSKYSNIKYYRNEVNVNDSNFSIALDRASGAYLKLMNDNLEVYGTALEYMKNKIKVHLEDRLPLFFTDGILYNNKKVDSFKCDSFEDFIVHISFFVTSIKIFGCWKEDWTIVKDRLKYTKLKLNQVDWAYQIVEKKGSCELLTEKFCSSLEVGKRGGYNWFQVHVENYYTIMSHYVDKGLVSKKALSIEKRTRLLGLRYTLIHNYLFDTYPTWEFDMSGAWKILWKYFKKEPLFYLMILFLPVWGSALTIRQYLLKNF